MIVMAEKEFHVRKSEDGLSVLVYSDIHTDYSGYAMGWYANSNTHGTVSHKIYMDGTYEEVNEVVRDSYDPIAGTTVKGTDAIDAVRKHFTDEYFNRRLTGDVAFNLEFKTPTGKLRSTYIRGEGLGVKVDSVESALQYGEKLAKKNKWVDVTWVPTREQHTPYNLDTLNGDKFWHPAAIERAKSRGLDAPGNLAPVSETVAEPDYVMVYSNSKGRTKTFHFDNGAKHKDIVVGDAESARAYAKAKADDWGVSLLGVDVIHDDLTDALTDLDEKGLEK